MGNWNSGRRPGPASLQQLRGNPGRRRLNENEPPREAAPESFDQVPDEIADNDGAAAKWTQIVPPLRAAGFVSTQDRDLLIAMCVEWSNYLRASKPKPKSVSGDSAAGGRTTRQRITALRAYLTLAQELGLTPSSRSRLTRLKAADPPPSEADRWKDAI